MNKLYYASADEAASQLGLPLLLAAASSVAVPRLGVRLSDHAPDTVLGARLYHRLNITETSEPLVLWVVSPRETVEHLGWAVGVAEHAARTGKIAYLFDLDRSSSTRALVSGDGHPLPPSVRGRIERLLVRAAAVWSSDLQGVRITLPVVRVPAGAPMETPAEWVLVIASALPESLQEVRRIGTEADGVVLTAGIRDHTREELELIVSALSKAGASMLGLVAMGPVPRKGGTPLDRWTEPDHLKPEVRRPKPQLPEAPEREEPIEARQPVEREDAVEREEPVAPGEKEWETETVSEERPAERAPTSVDLVAGWQSREQPKKGGRRLLLVLFVAVIVAGVGWIVTSFEDLPFTDGGESAQIAADSTTTTTAGRETVVASQEPVAIEYEPPAAEPEAVAEGREARQSAIDSALAAMDTLQWTVPPSEERSADAIPSDVEPPTPFTQPESEAADSFVAQVVEEDDWAPADTEPIDAEPTSAGSPDSGGVPLRPDPVEPETSASPRPPVVDTMTLPAAEVSPPEAPEVADSLEASRSDATEQDVTEPAEIPPPVVGEPEAMEIPVSDIPDTTVMETLLTARESFGIPGLEDVIEEKKEAWPDTFAIHVSSFTNRADAERDVERLHQAGWPARVVSVIIPGKGVWDRVVVGSYSDSAAAAADAARIRDGGLATWVRVLNHNGAGLFQRVESR